jgi:hypothetical protein
MLINYSTDKNPPDEQFAFIVGCLDNILKMDLSYRQLSKLALAMPAGKRKFSRFYFYKMIILSDLYFKERFESNRLDILRRMYNAKIIPDTVYKDILFYKFLNLDKANEEDELLLHELYKIIQENKSLFKPEELQKIEKLNKILKEKYKSNGSRF